MQKWSATRGKTIASEEQDPWLGEQEAGLIQLGDSLSRACE